MANVSLWNSKRGTASRSVGRVHQLVSHLAWGDAVGNQVRYLRDLLRGWGFDSEIYANEWDEACRDQVRPARDYPRDASSDSALLIHHSFESRLVPLVAKARGRKALLYHNVTPTRFFEGVDRHVAQGCTAAREELRALRDHVSHAWAYSHFSAEELAAAGYRDASVLPFAVDWNAFDVPPDPALRAQVEDGCANILFVGRTVPSKRLEDVLRVFTAYQRLYQPRSRLLVAGTLSNSTPYDASVIALREQLGPERVVFLGRVDASQLSACFASATAYLSMSRHEGFGVPLLEAMYRGVPVVAYGAAAVPETMGGAGLTTLSDDPVEVAGLLAVLERDAALRAQVVAAQRDRLAPLDQQTVARRVHEALTPFLEGRSPVQAKPGPDAATVVCPGFDTAPDAPMSRLARAVVDRMPGARLWTVRRGVMPLQLAPREERREGTPVWHFTPDEPTSPASSDAPASSSLETGVRCATGPVLFAGAEEVARRTAAQVQAHAWGVWEARRAPDAGVRRLLGPRLKELKPDTDVDALARDLARELDAGGRTHAR
ncbi:glycosyltransferase [Corallococcus praedator]|uniref:Glycosyltransferase n=1 Tax=Corallococcus praedator TaxID=2316724 RepID=A0ABX9QMN6_9BACT|nr:MULTISPECIES: glycosyltransferase [Corallococcus]RKH11201.1 glycosyltransferase [Corallococcus sp. CA047B]RKH36263.1 glycosyltransferase [Corallococcus sp. CA031C]RKI13762.1 glycosyltransferase [Corallococcus praedator]